MQVIFDGAPFVQYGFVWLSTLDGYDLPDLVAARGGQVNGLLGAALPGVLSVLTATHTGSVPLRVEAGAAAPVLNDAADDVVEASFEARSVDLRLQTFDDGADLTLPAAGSYRARLSCSAWDAAHDGTEDEDGTVPDRYLLQLWPAPPAPDAVLRQRSGGTAYWHGVAASTPAPDPDTPIVPAWQDEDDEDEETREAFWEQERARMRWGGTVPDDPRLLAVGGYAHQLYGRDRALVEALVDAAPAHQRAVALWAARRVCTTATDRVDWSVALDAVAAGRPVPPPFDDYDAVSAITWPPDPDAVGGTWGMLVASVGPAVRQPIDPTACAVPALAAAAQPDPLRAVLDAVEAAGWAEPDEKAFFAGVRAELSRQSSVSGS